MDPGGITLFSAYLTPTNKQKKVLYNSNRPLASQMRLYELGYIYWSVWLQFVRWRQSTRYMRHLTLLRYFLSCLCTKYLQWMHHGNRALFFPSVSRKMIWVGHVARMGQTRN